MKKFVLWRPEHLRKHAIADEVLSACMLGIRSLGHTATITSNAEKLDSANVVVTWGLGNPKAATVMQELVADGVSVVGWDLGYWERDGKLRKYRCSIDAIHPQAIVMRREREARPKTPKLIDTYNPLGPVLIIGMGFKSAETYYERPGVWEGTQLRKLREIFPDKRILFKPRPSGGLKRLPGVQAVTGPISQALRGASLAICRHSNVAVDAIIANVPAIADDGAAAAICPHDLRGDIAPLDIDTRTRFLSNLSWFQWTAAEMKQAGTWAAILEMCSDAKETRPCSNQSESS